MTVSLTFSQSFFEQNVSYSEIIAIFSDFGHIFESKAITDVFAELFRTNCLRTANIIAIFSDFCYFEIKPEMRDVLAGMREISQNAGFPARLRDG